ncbi:MAG: dinitrogenase iron-molybdenum cofactor biosynthesis protein [Candidatus Delongbacteria bacterium]|nr:dinitrogenase iron-molybdenum cofactor biosynthesis protein [Candidatus Delongbacteria bacterium]
MELITAFATDDGKLFMDRHFGDAKYYDIYRISASGMELIKRIDNTTEEEEEEIHADPRKAKDISGLLKEENVQVVVSKVFGPNIKRIKKNFVCVVMEKEKEIFDSIAKMQSFFDIIVREWEKGEDRLIFKI